MQWGVAVALVVVRMTLPLKLAPFTFELAVNGVEGAGDGDEAGLGGFDQGECLSRQSSELINCGLKAT